MKIKTIMLIDDSEEEHYLTEYVIKKYDPSLVMIQAYDGDEALAMLAEMEEHPSLILLDINMPRMNGFEFLEEYQKLYSSSVVVMLSSSDQGSDKKRAFEYSVVKQYIIKPIEVQDLENLAKLDICSK